MTMDERVQALRPLGFTPRQTRFLVTVALHSGFCLRRQYAAFAHIGYGAVVRDFLDTVVHRGLAQRIAYRRNRGFLYHLHGRSLYRAIGQEDNRNRRATSPALIARKLMLLDLAITEPDVPWYVTEADKVRLFTTDFQIPLAALPCRRYPAPAETPGTCRYFVHKLPIFTAGNPSVPHFVWLETETSGQGCASFLRDHAPLLARLAAWTLVAAVPAIASQTPGAEQAFRRFCQTAQDATGGAEHAELLWYCRVRRAVEHQQLAALSVTDLARFRELHGRVASASIDAQYQQWLTDGEAALTPLSPPDTQTGIPGGRFVTRVLPHTYSQFGDLPGVC